MTHSVTSCQFRIVIKPHSHSTSLCREQNQRRLRALWQSQLLTSISWCQPLKWLLGHRSWSNQIVATQTFPESDLSEHESVCCACCQEIRETPRLMWAASLLITHKAINLFTEIKMLRLAHAVVHLEIQTDMHAIKHSQYKCWCVSEHFFKGPDSIYFFIYSLIYSLCWILNMWQPDNETAAPGRSQGIHMSQRPLPTFCHESQHIFSVSKYFIGHIQTVQEMLCALHITKWFKDFY